MVSSTLSKPVRWFSRIVMVIALSVVLSLLKVEVGQTIVSTIYTVNGIMFSIALSLLISFSFSDIENDEFVRLQRAQLIYLRTVCIILFSLSTIAFIVSGFDVDIGFINPLCFSILIFGLIYNVVNFCGLAKAKSEIEDKIRNARKRR